MAARIRKIRHDEETRAKVKASQLLNRLTNHGLGKIDLKPTQVKAIEVALRKVLPDLAVVEHTGATEQHYVVHMPNPVKDLAEWRQVYEVPPKLTTDDPEEGGAPPIPVAAQ